MTLDMAEGPHAPWPPGPEPPRPRSSQGGPALGRAFTPSRARPLQKTSGSRALLLQKQCQISRHTLAPQAKVSITT